MESEFYQELFLTAVISIFFAFLLGKIIGGSHSEEEHLVGDFDSSHAHGEIFRRQTDEDLRAAADVFGIGEQLPGSKREITGVEELGGVVELVQERFEENRALLDKVGEEDEISDKMPQSADIERVSAKGHKEEEMDVEENEASSSSSDEKIVQGQWTEIGSDRGDDIITENQAISLLHGEDEWEGIERSELEKLFGVAAEYSASISGSMALARLSSDVQMELYGLHKIATEGPCYESQPLSLKVSARARWNAWQKLGRMAPEVAMDQYISLLSKSIPKWVVETSRENAELKRAAVISEEGILDEVHPYMGSFLRNQVNPVAQNQYELTSRKLEDLDSDEADSTTEGLKVLEQGLTGTFLLSLLFSTGGAFR